MYGKLRLTTCQHTSVCTISGTSHSTQPLAGSCSTVKLLRTCKLCTVRMERGVAVKRAEQTIDTNSATHTTGHTSQVELDTLLPRTNTCRGTNNGGSTKHWCVCVHLDTSTSHTNHMQRVKSVESSC
eukprot:m.353500 g.353500  ORF g.353500 m.353500 type:complete len:127 (+) comp16777_c0_seq1:661-1041(+)